MSSSAEEKPFFVLGLNTKKAFIRNLIIFAILCSFLTLLLPFPYNIVQFPTVFVVLLLVQYFGLERRFKTWKMEFYSSHYNFFFQGHLKQRIDYSQIARIEPKYRRFRKYFFVYARNENRILAVLSQDQAKRCLKELNNISVLDWLNTKIGSASATATDV